MKPMHLGDCNGDANPPNGIVYQSYMPDLYVYVDGKMTDNLGRPSSSRVQAGSWVNFSNIPGVNSDKGNAYGKCDVTIRRNGGNPWNVGIPLGPTDRVLHGDVHPVNRRSGCNHVLTGAPGSFQLNICQMAGRPPRYDSRRSLQELLT
ncbi:hypothetical protein [Streptomyces sp. NPDC090021]|uniref:hypothetical protein n=1 Tax=Streptomyces sp. NPDC090021 TaxID=3365919 RepID=UPI0038013F30